MVYDARHYTDDPLLRIVRHYIAILRGRRKILLSLIKKACKPFDTDNSPWVGRYDFAPNHVIRYIRRSVFRSASELLALKELMSLVVSEHDAIHSEYPARDCPVCPYVQALAENVREIERFME